MAQDICMGQDPFDRVHAERTLGHDLRVWGRLLPAECPVGVVEGFAAANVQGTSHKRPDRFVRKWLQLRLQALRRQKVINDDVTPDLLRRIDVPRCPVTRVVLSHGELLDTDWSVDRLNNDGAYAANNLAIMGAGANRAKGSRSFREVLLMSEKSVPADGLTPLEWLRMASIMLGPCFVNDPLGAPVIPLVEPIPNYSARQAVQLVQYLFTHGARTQSGKNALIKSFHPAARVERSAARLQVAAEAMHQGLKRVLEAPDVWYEPAVIRSFDGW